MQFVFLRYAPWEAGRGATLDILRTDVISLYDVDFRGERLRPSDVSTIGRMSEDPGIGRLNLLMAEFMRSGDPVAQPRREQKSSIVRLYEESYEWVYYGSALPGCRRFILPAPEGVPNAACSALLLRPENGAGVYSVWQTFEGPQDPLSLKQNAWDLANECLASLGRLGISVKEPERQYPFLAVRVDTDDIATYTEAHAEELGRIFTGNFERDERGYLIDCMKRNISKRNYERLFIRWTDVLALYDRRVDEREQVLTMLRAVQLYETCILARRVFRNLSQEADSLSSRLFLPFPWPVKRILTSFQLAEKQLVVGPPVQSVEAERILREAYKDFGIKEVVENARNSCGLLESRFQWAKTQSLVALGVITRAGASKSMQILGELAADNSRRVPRVGVSS